MDLSRLTDVKQQLNCKSNKVLEAKSFDAQHPMFRLEVEQVAKDFEDFLSKGEEVVVVGMGGSSLPLKVFVDFFSLQNKIILLDSPDPDFVQRQLFGCKKPVFCIVSKSGGTLEVAALLCHLLQSYSTRDFAVVTDPNQGLLLDWAKENQLPRAVIPPEIGGRFTNFTSFHEALLGRFDKNFQSVLLGAREEIASLKKDASPLAALSKAFMERPGSAHILWAYGEKLLGLAQWMQQALGESLGKRDKNNNRKGSLPVVLSGPQDQHSVLQLLADGPQDKLLWFLDFESFTKSPSFEEVPQEFSYLKGSSLDKVMKVLSRSTYQSFVERNQDEDSYQPLIHWRLEKNEASLGRAIARVQALIEYHGREINVNPFDQPGVEHGKKIAKKLMA